RLRIATFTPCRASSAAMALHSTPLPPVTTAIFPFNRSLFPNMTIQPSFLLPLQDIPRPPQIHHAHSAVIQPVSWTAFFFPEMTPVVRSCISVKTDLMVRLHDAGDV